MNNTSDWEKKGEQEGEEDSGPEYIPKRKAKNPMKVIGYAWYVLYTALCDAVSVRDSYSSSAVRDRYVIFSYRIIGLPAGIIGFILAKRQVDKNRLQQLKIRQRMKKSNEGEYERERYKPAARMQ